MVAIIFNIEYCRYILGCSIYFLKNLELSIIPRIFAAKKEL